MMNESPSPETMKNGADRVVNQTSSDPGSSDASMLTRTTTNSKEVEIDPISETKQKNGDRTSKPTTLVKVQPPDEQDRYSYSDDAITHQEVHVEASIGTKTKEYKISSDHYSYQQEGFKSKDPGKYFWVVIVVLPAVFSALVFAVVPVGKPESQHIAEFGVFVFFTVPVVCGVVVWFHFVSFLFMMQVDRPFHTRLVPVLVVMASCSGLCALIWASETSVVPPRFLGGWLIAFVLLVAWISIPLVEMSRLPEHERDLFKRKFMAFVKVEFVLVVFYVLLVCYVMAWRFGPDLLQRFLPVILALMTFIFRKIFLSITHAFALEPAMLVSSFWVENMDDMFQVMSFPSVVEPSSFWIIWVVPAATNVAHLLFLTDRWFLFRIWVKEFLKRLCCCGRRGSPWEVHEVPDLSHKPDDRGHSNNRPGYRRRQVRFFLWKMLSQLFAMFFYIINATILRYGVNKAYFPFDDQLSHANYLTSMSLCAGNVIFIALASMFGIHVVSTRHPRLYEELKDTHMKLLADHKYVGFVTAIVVHNSLLAIMVVMVHFQIWYGFKDPDFVN